MLLAPPRVGRLRLLGVVGLDGPRRVSHLERHGGVRVPPPASSCLPERLGPRPGHRSKLRAEGRVLGPELLEGELERVAVPAVDVAHRAPVAHRAHGGGAKGDLGAAAGRQRVRAAVLPSGRLLRLVE